MMRFWQILCVLILCSGTAMAEIPKVAPEPGLIGLLKNLPEATLKRLQKTPEKFLTEASALIFGYGTDGAIDLAGLDQYIALERAEARARAMSRLLAGDLNNDGAVDQGEITSLSDAASARERGRLRQAHRAADGEEDGTVDMDELRAAGQKAALDKLSDSDATVLRGFMACDLDGNGWVSLPEVREVTHLLAVEI